MLKKKLTRRQQGQLLIHQLAALLGMALSPNGIKNRSEIESKANSLLIGGPYRTDTSEAMDFKGLVDRIAAKRSEG
jgi:hypothetical protein